MPQVKLSNSFINSIKPTGKTIDYSDSEVKGLVLRVKPTGNMVWRLNYRNKDKIQKRYTIAQFGTITLTQARKEAQRLNGLISQDIDIQLQDKENKSKNYSYMEYLEEFYFDWFKNHHKSWVKNNKWLKTIATSLNNKSLEFVSNKGNISKFMQNMKESNKWSNSTYNRILAMIKGSITRAVEFDYLPFNGLSGMKSLKVNSSKFRYLSEDETKRFFEALPNQTKLAKDIISIAYYTGMRKSEILGLKCENIDYETNQIKLNASDTKTNKFRNIPIHCEVKKILNSFKGKKGLIFKNYDGGMVTQIEKQWKKFKKEAEIENFRFHDLRHNFCSMLVMKGIPIYTVAQLAGHADVKTTQIYAHLSPDVKKSAVDLL